MISINIAGVDRSNYIEFGSISIKDKIDNGSDTADFTIHKYGDQTYTPDIGDEVIIEADGIRIYGGVIVTIKKGIDGSSDIVHDIECSDYTQYLNRELVVERYENSDVQTILLDLLSRYAPDFTGTNIRATGFPIKSISFNEISMSDSISKLAKLTGYSWYVDNTKDLHFIKKDDETAPFDITDENGNYIIGTFNVTDSLSQIRNKVKVRGGQGTGLALTEKYAGNGSQATFPLGHKFSVLPTVSVDGVSKTVGVDNIDADGSFQCMWSFQQKYIRFTTGNTPGAPVGPATTNVLITGTPIIPIVVQVQDPASVLEFGIYEYVINDDSIASRDDAIKYAQAELQGYANGLKDAEFQTYTPGLHSGQTLTINSSDLDVNESFIIQEVNFQQIGIDQYLWKVSLATKKTLSLIDVLQQLLRNESPANTDTDLLLNFRQLFDEFTMTDSIVSITPTTTENYLWEQGNPGSDTYTNPIVWNEFTWA
jgi:hypothetical protein